MRAVTVHFVEHSGYRPDEVSADNLGAMTAQSFAYLGTLLKHHAPEEASPELKAMRKLRIGSIERAIGPLAEAMDPEKARGICAVVAGMARVHFLRGMHDTGASAGRKPVAPWSGRSTRCSKSCSARGTHGTASHARRHAAGRCPSGEPPPEVGGGFGVGRASVAACRRGG